MAADDKKTLGRIALRKQAVAAGGPRGAIEVPLQAQGGEDSELYGLSERFGVPALDLYRVCIRLQDLEILPREIAERHEIIPVLVRDDKLFVAMVNPGDSKVTDELEFVTGRRVFPYVASRAQIVEVVAAAYDLWARREPYYVGPDASEDVLQQARSGDEGALAAATASAAGFAGGSSGAGSPGVGSFGAGSPDGGAAASGLPRMAGSVRHAPLDSLSEDSLPPRADVFDPEAAAVEVRDSIAAFDESDFGDVSEALSRIPDVFEPPELEEAAPAAKAVLVVEDEPEIAGMIERVLVQKGYRVNRCDNGRVALRLVKEHTPDAIVLDAMLPEVHGFDIARRLKASEKYRDIPIVMVSAVYRGWRYAQDLKESCGVNAFLEKPFKIRALVEALEAAMAVEPEAPPRDREEIAAEAERELNAGVSAYKAGRTEDAVAHLRRGIEIDPFAYRLYFHLGLLYGKQGHVYDAIDALDRAVEINSEHFPAVKNLAVLYQKAGFRSKAVEMWERALSVAPDDDTRQSIKKHLVSLL